MTFFILISFAFCSAITIQIFLSEFEVTVVTGDKMFAGTDANVFITFYGNHGVSQRVPLKNRSKDLFERGKTDTFLVELKKDIGKVSKVR